MRSTNNEVQVARSNDRGGFLEAIKKSRPKVGDSEQIILVPKTDVIEDRLGNTFSWIFESFEIGTFVVFLMAVIPKNDERELNDFKKDKPLNEDDLKDILEFLVPRGPNKATAIHGKCPTIHCRDWLAAIIINNRCNLLAVFGSFY